MAKYFRIPFAEAGDRVVIPDTEQPSGAVSYTEGFGPDYEKDIDTDPSAKPVPRDETNELYFEITTAIQEYQQLGTPIFISTSDNDGVPFPYEINARVRYNPGSGYKTYQSLVGTNTALPTDTTKWILVDTPAGGYVVPSQIQKQSLISGTDTGSPNVVVATVSPTFTPLLDSKVVIEISHNNTGAATLALNGGSALPIQKRTCGGLGVVGVLVDLEPGDLLGNIQAQFTYGVGNIWVLDNPPSVSREQVQAQSLVMSNAGGTANALTATPSPAYIAYTTSGAFAKIGINMGSIGPNTGAATLNVSGLGVLPIVKMAQDNIYPLVGGEIGKFGYHEFILTGTEAILLNPVTQEPPGSSKFFRMTTAPLGWLIEDGSAVSRTTYAHLFSLIGVTYGSGDGSTTFNVPNLERRTNVGSGGSSSGILGNAVGDIGGAETHTQSIAEMPTHDHSPVEINYTTFGYTAGGVSANSIGGGSVAPDGAPAPEGSGTPFNIMQPSMIGLSCIKA